MTQTVKEVLTNAVFYTDETDYALIQLPNKAVTLAASIIAEVADPFITLIVDKDEITLFIQTELVQEFSKRLERVPNHQVSDITYRLITLDVELEADLVGLMARIAEALAGANISVLSIAAYTRDHLFVAKDDVELALNTLQKLKENR